MSVFKSKYQDEYHNLKKEILDYVVFGVETSISKENLNNNNNNNNPQNM